MTEVPARAGARADAATAELCRLAAALELGAPVVVRRSARARRIRLRVDAAARTIELVLPLGVAPRRGGDFLAAQRGWVAARLVGLPPPMPFVEGALVPVFGVPHVIRRESDPEAPPVAIVGAEIRVRGEEPHVARRVRDHLVRLARSELGRRAQVLAAALGRPVGRVSVRDTKSRWGSCSSAGNLSFCWRLVLAPHDVVDYVVAHEVAHLAEMNHGPRFWRLVGRMVQDPAAQRAWLRRNRLHLLAYG